MRKSGLFPLAEALVIGGKYLLHYAGSDLLEAVNFLLTSYDN